VIFIFVFLFFAKLANQIFVSELDVVVHACNPSTLG
jgi:hypothetical protein